MQRRHIFIRAIAVIAIILACALAYLDLILLPTKGKRLIETELGKILKKTVSIKHIGYNPFRGITASDIIISEKELPLITIDRIWLNVSPWPLLLKREAHFKLSSQLNLNIPLTIQARGVYKIDQHSLTLDARLAGIPIFKTVEGNVTLTQFGIDALRGGLRLTSENMSLLLKMDLSKGKQAQSTIEGSFYGGSISSNIEIDLNYKNPPYKLDLTYTNIDLSRLAKETQGQRSDIQGLAKGRLMLMGYGANTQTVRGKGWFEISEGRLWDIPILSKLSEALYLPGLRKLIVTEASGSFIVANKRISTSDLALTSGNVVFNGAGNVGFDGSLAFNVTARLTEELIRGSSQFARFTRLLTDEAGRFILELKLYGTIKEPRYLFVPLSIDKAIDKVRDLFQGILNK